MKQLSHSMLAAATLALSGIILAAPAMAAPATAPIAGEHRLSAKEIRDIAKRELLWCDDYRAQTGTCFSVTLIQLAPDGRLAETTELLLSDGPRIQAFIGEVDDVKGDAVCSKVSASTLPTAFTMEGKAVPADDAAGLRSILMDPLAEFEGKTICQSFFRGADPNVLREEVTVDGARRKDLETTYQLHDGHDGFSLRPRVGAGDDGGQKT